MKVYTVNPDYGLQNWTPLVIPYGITTIKIPTVLVKALHLSIKK